MDYALAPSTGTQTNHSLQIVHTELHKARAHSPPPYVAQNVLNPQLDCAFLRKLPVEIRLMIYEDVIRSWGWTGGVHIYQTTAPQTHRRSLKASPCDWDGPLKAALKAINPVITWAEAHSTCQGWKPSKTLALFRSCRQIYTEAIGLLYSSFRFDLLNLETATHFFSSVPQKHWERITAIKVSAMSALDAKYYPHGNNAYAIETHLHTQKRDWHSLCLNLAELKALRKLTFTMPSVGLGNYPEGRMSNWLVDIKQVSRPNFVVVVPLRTVDNLDFLDSQKMPFTIKTVPRWDFPRWFEAPVPVNREVDIRGFRRPGTRRRRQALWKRVLLCPLHILYISGELAVNGLKGLKRRMSS